MVGFSFEKYASPLSTPAPPPKKKHTHTHTIVDFEGILQTLLNGLGHHKSTSNHREQTQSNPFRFPLGGGGGGGGGGVFQGEEIPLGGGGGGFQGEGIPLGGGGGGQGEEIPLRGGGGGISGRGDYPGVGIFR